VNLIASGSSRDNTKPLECESGTSFNWVKTHREGTLKSAESNVSPVQLFLNAVPITLSTPAIACRCFSGGA
jgi:hypothetical protein